MARARNHYSLPLRLEDVLRSSKRFSSCHVGKLKHAIDFDCEEGTRIYAALGGRIVYVKQDSNIGGPDKKFFNDGNRIVIRHASEEYSAYEHLRYNGVCVNVGQIVRRGELIGFSGNTGASYGPHLHFEVFNNPVRDESEGTTLQVFIQQLIEEASRQ